MKLRTELLACFAAMLILALNAMGQPPADQQPARYSSMAPLDQYLMSDRSAEAALARSAAPVSISGAAKILVLGAHGYETAVEGKNGWVCVVERGWMSPFDSSEFWNPKIRGPICFNPPAARSILPMTYKRTEMALAGQTKAQILEGLKTAFDRKELPALEPGAMSYMMSKGAYLTDHDDHNLAHLMFYTSVMDSATWGADLPDTPVMATPQFKDCEPVNVFIVPVGRWSDGTSAPVM